ncbi:MAG TPA: DegV family protein [Bacillota bacterium]|nr:DegV family protein [Bacillota bacterium]HPT87620.1 DegV family protein [Bacillota bacterium]
MAVKIVTDSTADIPEKLVKEYGIGVVPLNIHFGDEVLKDGVDIWSEEFYHRLKNEAVLPTTSQPAPGEFLKVYESIGEPGDTIISIHISGEMSGTVRTARIAADMLEDKLKIHVIDSRYVCMALGMLVLRAAKLAKEGASPEVIIAEVERLSKELAVYFTVNSLEYLSRNGRIGKATSFLGGLLNIKPLLGIEGGVIVPTERIRGNFSKIATELVTRFVERYGEKPVELWCVHTEMPELAVALQQEAMKRLNVAASHIGLIGPIVGTHAGPYIVGMIGLPME